MNSYLYLGLGSGVLFLIGSFCGYLLFRWKEKHLKEAIDLREKTILENAGRQAESILREARLKTSEDNLVLREEAEKVSRERTREIQSIEQKLQNRQLKLSTHESQLSDRERDFQEKNEQCEKTLHELESERRQIAVLRANIQAQLERISQLSATEARQSLLKQVEEESLREANQLSKNVLEDARLRAEEKARKIIGIALQRYAGEHAFETSTATVALTGDDIKGRIIGREGRNIRAFEAATGVTVLIDDTPNAVVLSGFDPVRREVARESMQRLILDGRIHPTRIEEIVAKVTQEIDETIVRQGEEALAKVGLPPMHLEVVKLLGRLHFRHSFSQNILNHSIEVAQLTGLMASELGIDIISAKKAGLLHDIGKAMNHEIEGAHAIVGADFLRRHGEADDVVNGVAAHHDEVPHTGILGVLVSAADAMSASRPGARSETMTTYIKRVENLEKIGMSFPGVEKCYAVQAGRELRVMVQPDQLNDEQAFALARNIARKIEDDLVYPGQIRVTVMRETRCIEFAK